MVETFNCVEFLFSVRLKNISFHFRYYSMVAIVVVYWAEANFRTFQDELEKNLTQRITSENEDIKLFVQMQHYLLVASPIVT